MLEYKEQIKFNDFISISGIINKNSLWSEISEEETELIQGGGDAEVYSQCLLNGTTKHGDSARFATAVCSIGWLVHKVVD